MQVRCPQCQTPIELTSDGELSDIACPACGSSFSLLGTAETVPYETGPKTIGHFELVERIGVGTFGFVWKARDTQLDRIVALKIPRKGQLDPDESEQFLREARAAAQLRHPGIVSVHEVGRSQDTVFIVSDFVEGTTLADRLTAQRFSIRESADLCAKIADALHHAHEAGVVHRDLKPGNVILDASGEPHIMDFGLARREAGEVTMTVEGRVLGTPAYMSPEQAKGSAHTADRRSDVYSLGVILFEMLTGERPFRGNVRMLINQVINDEPPSPRRLNGSVPRDLETISLRCLEKEPGRRYGTAKELASDMRRFLVNEPILARPISRTQRAYRWCARNRLVACLILLVATALAGGTFVSSYFAFDAANRAQEASTAADAAEKERDNAQKLANELRQQAYILDMNEAQIALAEDRISRVGQLLRQYIPDPNEPDLRQFEWYYLWDAWKWESRVVRLPQGLSVCYVATSPNREVLAVADAHGGVQLWDLETRQPMQRIVDGNRSVWKPTFVRFSPDGDRLIFSRSEGHRLVVRHLETQNEVELEGIGRPFVDAAITADDKTLVALSKDNFVHRWDVEQNRTIGAPQEFKIAVSAFECAPTAQELACGGDAGTLAFWNLTTDELVEVPGHSGRIRSLAWSKDGTRVATGGEDGVIKIWDAAKRERLVTLVGQHSPVSSLAFTQKGKQIVAGSEDSAIRLWDIAICEPVATFHGYRGVYNKSLAVSYNDDVLAYGTRDYHVVLRDLSRERRRGATIAFTSDGPMAVSPDGTTLATVGERVTLTNLNTWQTEILLDDTAYSVAFSSHGLLACSQARSVLVWDLTTKRKLVEIPVLHAEDVAFLHNKQQLVVGTTEGMLAAWDLSNGERPVLIFLNENAHLHTISAVDVSHNDRTIATASWDRTVKLWSADSGQQMDILYGHTDLVNNVAFSPTDDCLASVSFDRTVRVWDLKDRSTEPKVLEGHTRPGVEVYFARDGNTIVAPTRDDRILLWDRRSGNRRFTFKLQGALPYFAITPDGRTILSRTTHSVRLLQSATPYQVEAEQ